MNRNLLSRSLAVLLLGILFGYYIAVDERKTRQMDREQYLEREGRKFDESKSEPTPTSAMVIGGVIVVAGVLFLYEIVVMGISAALKTKTVNSGNPMGNINPPFS